MAAKNEFDLNENLNIWKKRICNSSVMGKSNYVELESHLLDIIDDLKAKGLNEEEAYLLAIRRLGDTQSLSQEYEKVHSNNLIFSRLTDFIAGIVIYLIITSFGKVVSSGLFVSSPFVGISQTNLAIINAILLSLIATLIVVLVYLFLKNFTGEILKMKLLPLSISLLLILKLMQFSLVPLAMNTVGNKSYSFELLGTLQLHASVFNMGIMLIVFTLAIVVFLNNRKAKRDLQIV